MSSLFEPHAGAIAVCGIGCLGYITSTEPKPDGDGKAWKGIHLESHPDRGIEAGDPWSSRNPKVINTTRK